jgi:hypothetical protein
MRSNFVTGALVLLTVIFALGAIVALVWEFL